MANIKQTDKQLLELVLNKLESPEVFNYMDENNLLESDQLYFVVDNDERAIAEYDKNNNGIVDDAEMLGGNLPSYYASTELTGSLGDLSTANKSSLVAAINEVRSYIEETILGGKW